eukprot:403331771
MVEHKQTLTRTDQYNHLLNELERVTQGTHILATYALFDGDFKEMIMSNFLRMIEEIEKVRAIKDEEQIDELLPAIYEEKQCMQMVRNIYFRVIENNKPERFSTRVEESREYSHTLKVNFRVADFLNSIFLKQIIKFFVEKILLGLESQFDRLCVELLAILSEREIDYKSGVMKIQEMAPNVPPEIIEALFSDVEKVPFNKRNDHKLMQKLQEQELKHEDRQNEPEQQVNLVKQQSLKPENKTKVGQMIKENTQKYLTKLKNLKNPEAEKFYVTFFNDCKKKVIESDDVYSNFRPYFWWKTGRQIDDTNENRSIFKDCIENMNFNVGYADLDAFFDKYVDFKTNNILIDKLVVSGYATSPEDEITQTLKFRREERSFRPQSFQVKFKVLDDFQDTPEHQQIQKTQGILKAGVTKTFLIEDGKTVNFGGDSLCDYPIPIPQDIDPFSFSISNKNGNLFMIDRSDEKAQTKLQVDTEIGLRLNTGDFLDIGLALIMHVRRSTNIKPLPSNDEECLNIRYIPSGFSREVSDYMKQQFHYNSQPELEIEYFSANGQHKNKIIRPADCPIMIGRLCRDGIAIDDDDQYCSVSRKHCQIHYDEKHGFYVKDHYSSSGTWAHLKTYHQSKNTTLNSYPVLMYQKMQVKVLSFLFEFEFEPVQN